MESDDVSVDILYVDDDEVDVQNALREFKKINELLNIAVAGDAQEALDILYGRNGKEKIIPAPKVILLDINMPKMNGIELLKTLRNDPDFSATSIFILTASYNTEDKIALRDLHPTGCIVKPLEYSDALNIFWSLLHER